MNNTHFQFVLREWWSQMRHPRTIVITAGVGLVLALAAPFETSTIGLLPRIAYWLLISFVTFGTGSLVSLWFAHQKSPRPRWQAVAIIGLASAALILPIILLINWAVFGWVPTGHELPTFLLTTLAITIVVTGVFHLTSDLSSPEPDIKPVPLLDRLPLDKRGPLVMLGVEDHYVKVRTTKGEALVLMRLSDAIRETGNIWGAQVHRSYWVAFDQVVGTARQGNSTHLTMCDGSEVPVSRANVSKIKEAGLLPR